MEEYVQLNTNALINSKFNEFRINGKYCDVDLLVETNVFKCHQLILGVASPYFDAMFCENFKEGTRAKVVLPEIETSVFQSVLEFIYTGKVTITNRNVFNMIRASVSYKLHTLGKVCAQYVQKHLDHLFKIDKFLDMSFDELHTILSMMSVPYQNQKVLVRAIVRWTQHGRVQTLNGRKQHFKDLLEKFNFSNISPEYMKYLEEGNNAHGDTLRDVSMEHSEIGGSVNQKLLYLYIKSSDCRDTVTNVYTLHESMGEYSWELSCEASLTFDFVRSVTLHNRLYSLGYSECLPIAKISPLAAVRRSAQVARKIAVISSNPYCDATKKQKMSGKIPVQTFSTSSSVSLFVDAYLKPPPLMLNKFEMCGMGESIYIYDRNAASNIIRNVQSSSFDEEELARGVYHYNRDVDVWLPLSPLREKNFNACMTCDNQRVYIIGGTAGARGVSHSVQAYDNRTRDWQMLESTFSALENSTCCVHKGKVHVCYYNDTLFSAEMYDPVAGKWERRGTYTVASEPRQYCKLLSYEDILLAVYDIVDFGSFTMSQNW
jgi:hypothetical protein